MHFPSTWSSESFNAESLHSKRERAPVHLKTSASTLFLSLTVFFLLSCSNQTTTSQKEPQKSPTTPDASTPSTEHWEQYWEKFPAAKLPTPAPEGSLKELRLALKRQLEVCRAYLSNPDLKGHPHCRTETVPVRLECDLETLQKLHDTTRTSSNWKAFYGKVKKAFDFYRYSENGGSVLYTGYNSPTFQASLIKTSKFAYPAYARPADLVNFQDEKGQNQWRRKMPDGSYEKYFSRKEIDLEKALEGKGLEVAWFEHPTEVLRLQIEGSGVLEVRDSNGLKKILGINFAGKNGHPYTSVFKILKEKGVDKKYLTFPGLRKFFDDFPDQMWPVLAASPSYVFFSVGEEPPCGTSRTHVTGGHSLAVDPTHFPLGLVGFVVGERPVEGSDAEKAEVPMKKFSRFAVAQDTGGAIKKAHVDIYWGASAYAHLASNTMKRHGELFRVKLKSK
jgi:membrane-bound lytic murein transglycosylase